jgi:hypothetical protein
MTHNAFDAYEVSTSTGRAGLAEGERRRDAATALLAVNREVLVRRGCRLFVRHLLETGTATADDIAEAIETGPEIDRRLLGTVPLRLVRAEIAELDGYRRSTRPERHASVIAIWRLTDRDAAMRWLAENPLLSELKTARQLEMELNLANDEPATVAAAAGSV